MSGSVGRIIRVIGWSAGFALLFAAVLGLVRGWDSILRPAVVGIMFGAILGGVNERLVTRWIEGALVGAILGLVIEVILVLAIPSTEGMLPPVGRVFVFTVGSAIVGAIIAAWSIPMWGGGGKRNG